MTGLGLAATAAAFLNYKSAKKNYDQVQERTEGVNLIVNSYQQILEEYLSRDARETEEAIEENKLRALDAETERLIAESERDIRPEGVQVGVLVRVGNLVGKLLRTETTLVITNTGSDGYYIHGVYINDKIYDVPFWPMEWKSKETFSKYKKIDRVINPGQTIEIIFPKGVTTVVMSDGSDGMDDLRNAICEANGKRLITSCGKTNLDGIAKATVILFWSTLEEKGEMLERYEELFIQKPGITASSAIWAKYNEQNSDDGIIGRSGKVFNVARWLDFPATLRYCGEAYL